jgi:hypothetical protein
MATKNFWSEAEMILCLTFYSNLEVSQRKVPPPHITKRLADLTGRTQSSIELRFANYSHYDPDIQALGLKGMSGGGSKVAEIWSRFASNDGSLNTQLLAEWLAMNFFDLSRLNMLEKTTTLEGE